MLTILSNKPLQRDKIYFHTLKAPLIFQVLLIMLFHCIRYFMQDKIKGT